MSILTSNWSFVFGQLDVYSIASSWRVATSTVLVDSSSQEKEEFLHHLKGFALRPLKNLKLRSVLPFCCGSSAVPVYVKTMQELHNYLWYPTVISDTNLKKRIIYLNLFERIEILCFLLWACVWSSQDIAMSLLWYYFLIPQFRFEFDLLLFVVIFLLVSNDLHFVKKFISIILMIRDLFIFNHCSIYSWNQSKYNMANFFVSMSHIFYWMKQMS